MSTDTADPVNDTQDFERSTTMHVMNQNMAREHMNARLKEARNSRRGYQLARARRLSRKAERAAAQARLALARAL